MTEFRTLSRTVLCVIWHCELGRWNPDRVRPVVNPPSLLPKTEVQDPPAKIPRTNSSGPCVELLKNPFRPSFSIEAI